MIFLFTLSCTAAPVQPAIQASTKVLSTAVFTATSTTDGLALYSTERAATVFALQTASATALPTRLPTETLTPTSTLTPAPHLLSP